MRRLALFLVIAGCARAIAPKPEVPAPSAVATPAPPAPGAGVAAAPAAPARSTCALIDSDTIDDGEGKIVASPQGPGSMVLDDVRVLAGALDDAAGTTVVTWTRRAQWPVGDTWRTPHLAIKTAAPSGRDAGAASGWTKTTLPVLGYACATYGTVAPNTIARPFVAWGVANTTAFELWKDIPDAKDTTGHSFAYTPSLAQVSTPRSSVDHFVASRDVALAMATEETCDVSCTCTDPAHHVMALRSLDPKTRFSVRLGQAEASYENRPDAPALAMGPSSGVAAYRHKKKLYLAWLDAAGRPGPVAAFAEGDVGAPAVAMSGSEAIVVWAQRAAKDAPYRLRMLRLAAGAAPDAASAQIRETPGSAFAPAVLASDSPGAPVIFAWMEGDTGTHGAIHVARDWTGPSTLLSGDETNARDPELSGTPAHPTIVWQTFPKEQMAGLIRVGRLDCASPKPHP